MIIKSLYISGLFNQFDYTLNLCDGLTFIHAQNGFGKSTVMRMVYAAMKGDVRYLSETPFTRLDIGFFDGTNLIIENNSGELLIQMQKNELETEITPEEMADICDVTYISPERLVIKKKDGHLAPALETYAQELYERIRYSREHSELVPYGGKRKEMTDSELEFWCKDLKAKLDFIKDAGFEPDMPSGIRFPPSRYDIMDNRKQCEDLAYSVSEYVDRSYQLAESIIVFKDIINNIYINKNIDVTENGKLIVAMNNGTTLPLSKLSSGEKQILLIFYQMLFHSNNGSIILVDEPEISLHVTWQQMLGDYFCDICRVRNVQMIVATHSPQVIHDRWDYAKELVQKNA